MFCCVFQVICNLAVSFLLLSLSVSGTTNGSEEQCLTQVKVTRNTEFKARVTTVLKINCTVSVHGCHRSPRVSWCKLSGNECNALSHSDYIKSEWKNTAVGEGIAFLTFLNISMEDAGSYRCKENNLSVSHSIHVNVTLDNKEDEISNNQRKTSDTNTFQNDDQQWLWPYVYICCGIAGLVLIVMIVTLLFIRCQGKKSTRKEIANTKQYMETPRSDQPPPHPHHNTRPPSDQLTSALYRSCETPPIRGASSAGRVSDGRHNTVCAERGEGENALVYASLNHQAMSRGPRRTARQEQAEPSEYAAVRFR